GAEGDEDLVHIPAVIATVLVFAFHDSDNGVRQAVDVNALAHSGTGREELLFDIAAQESHAPPLSVVSPVVEPAFRDADGTNLSERGKRTGHLRRGIVVKTAGG